jgi:hypothetical protein
MTVPYYTLRQSQANGGEFREETFELRHHTDVGLTKYLRYLSYSYTGEGPKSEIGSLSEKNI